MAVLDPSERAELTFDCDAGRVSALDDLPGDANVVSEVRRRLAIREQRLSATARQTR